MPGTEIQAKDMPAALAKRYEERMEQIERVVRYDITDIFHVHTKDNGIEMWQFLGANGKYDKSLLTKHGNWRPLKVDNLPIDQGPNTQAEADTLTSDMPSPPPTDAQVRAFIDHIQKISRWILFAPGLILDEMKADKLTWIPLHKAIKIALKGQCRDTAIFESMKMLENEHQWNVFDFRHPSPEITYGESRFLPNFKEFQGAAVAAMNEK